MARPRSMANILGVFKDKISIVKATLVLAKRPISAYRIAVLRATTHDPSTPPPEYVIEDVLSLGLQSRSTAAVFIDALMNRLHGTGDAFVALKCLITIHNIIQRGSTVFKDQISHYPTNGGHNFLNLSTFRDGSGPDWRELSGWVRWYAGVIERNLIVSRVLGFYISSLEPSKATVNRKGRATGYSNFELLKELNSLVAMVEEISNAPESLHYQRISSIYEVMKLVGEDYRMAMREVSTILSELEVRIEERLSTEEMSSLLSDLNGLENCREKLVLMFLNKKKNDGIWELISELREKVVAVREMRENLRVVVAVDNRGRGGSRSESNQLTGSDERVVGRRSESWELLLPAPSTCTNPWELLLPTPSACTNPWLDVDEKSLTISMA